MENPSILLSITVCGQECPRSDKESEELQLLALV
jgi:hypothetical protein